MASRKRIPHINLPDYTGIASTIINNTILFVTIEHDSDVENPCENWDGFGSIRSLSRRHINNICIEEAVNRLKTDPDVVALSYFEHGQSLWMVKDEPAPLGVEFEWDGIRFAGIWIPDDCVRESYTGQDCLTRREWMIKQAKSACETYTQWINGEVYGYEVGLYTIRRDDEGDPIEDLDYYRHHDPVSEDSCWGHYGHVYAREQALDAVKSILKEQKFSRRAIDAAIKEAA